jgi:formate-dependent nitrite reductase membrane component NrfD
MQQSRQMSGKVLRMIPTMIVLGLFIGLLHRPWNAVGVLVAASGWALFLVTTGTVAISDPLLVTAAFLLGGLNALEAADLPAAA